MSHYEVQDALRWENANELKHILRQDHYHDIKNLNGETQLLEFLNRKLKLNATDLRIVLLLLRAGTNVDYPDYSGFTARKKLATLGYRVDRIYLSITQAEINRLKPIVNELDSFDDMFYK
jgi:hypothetical protein